MFKAFLQHKARRKQIRNRQGFDYAAGELLRNPTAQTLKTLEWHVQSAKDFEEYDEFDKGIEDALNQFALLSPSLVHVAVERSQQPSYSQAAGRAKR